MFPIFSGMALFVLGYVLLVANVTAVLGATLGWIGIQTQVRRVEEPFLTAVHGDPYRRYAERVGRFLPRLGRIRD